MYTYLYGYWLFCRYHIHTALYYTAKGIGLLGYIGYGINSCGAICTQICFYSLYSAIRLSQLAYVAIWPLALSGLGRFTKIGSSLLVMGIAGAAVFPPIYGLLVDAMSAQTAYIILVPIYLFILYFASIGYKKGKHVVAV
jgi:fucose permease